MLSGLRVSAWAFYFILLFLLSILVFLFVFSDKGFRALENKEAKIEEKESLILSLETDIIQISDNINRLKTDKEYILSYAKTYGYLDKAKNEQIIKIIGINDNDTPIINKDVSESASQQQVASIEDGISVVGIAILSAMVLVCILFYIFVLASKKGSQRRYG